MGTNDVNDDVLELVRSRLGTTLCARWRLDDVLGIGGMATVYSATHRNGRRVAIKMLHGELSVRREIKSRFLREGYVANKVGHQGVAAVLDDDVAPDGTPFIVMELLEGETLEHRWLRNGLRLDLLDLLPIIDHILDVLVAAHGKGIVHRDLKPANIFITMEGHAKVLDFGIARMRELSFGSDATRQGTMMGTPHFMPPEQARGEMTVVDERSDLWAVGAIMFTMISGRYVHDAPTDNQRIAMAMYTPAPRVRDVAQQVSSDVATLVDRAIAFDLADRWPSAEAFQRELRSVYYALVAHGASQALTTSSSTLARRRESEGAYSPRTVPLPDAPQAVIRDGVPTVRLDPVAAQRVHLTETREPALTGSPLPLIVPPRERAYQSGDAQHPPGLQKPADGTRFTMDRSTSFWRTSSVRPVVFGVVLLVILPAIGLGVLFATGGAAGNHTSDGGPATTQSASTDTTSPPMTGSAGDAPGLSSTPTTAATTGLASGPMPSLLPKAPGQSSTAPIPTLPSATKGSTGATRTAAAPPVPPPTGPAPSNTPKRDPGIPAPILKRD